MYLRITNGSAGPVLNGQRGSGEFPRPVWVSKGQFIDDESITFVQCKLLPM